MQFANSITCSSPKAVGASQRTNARPRMAVGQIGKSEVPRVPREVFRGDEEQWRTPSGP